MKKIHSFAIAMALILTIGLTGQAQVGQPQPLTDNQKSEMVKDYEAKYQEAQEKFNALTDKQKKELYDLYDKINVNKLKLLDKYVEFGLVSKEEADVIRAEMGNRAQEMRDTSKFIGFGGMRHHKAHKVDEIAKDTEVKPETDEKNEVETQSE
ncbi:MAG: DUF2680 domain-containing protein [Turicibacter sp.]